MVMEPVQSFRSMQVYIHLILGLTKWLFSFEPNQSEFKNTHKASSALPNILKRMMVVNKQTGDLKACFSTFSPQVNFPNRCSQQLPESLLSLRLATTNIRLIYAQKMVPT